MKLGRAELPVILLLAAVAAAAASFTADHLQGHPQPLLAELRGVSIGPGRYLLFELGMACLAAAMILGIGWILPAMRHQTREQNKLQSLAGLLRKRSQDLEQAAVTDSLTGMHNRRFFDQAMEQYIEEFTRVGRPLGLVVIDLDRFKAINDTYGHDVGDEVLRALAACLFEFARFNDVAARLGGEEFAILAPNMEMMELRRFANSLREAIASLDIKVGSASLRVTASMGLSVSQSGDVAATLFKRADINLYQAKQAGRNRICAA
ncbi:GGDEF domain-containing protein [Aurantimonas sp. VKM B-3413]|uniref:GGDEF domain-containing protein n=1 Tax=Aurantimonas sp. VKM B-3413 TaxID=2779401 RepID=UPI001E32B356|nr:GGDEF domain-containing protein [Aurantimonas sp. VKM B-3413]MCB8835873.1 GGDEF domain-containing protein [Aurantimonas sp. VKM B-3413]